MTNSTIDPAGANGCFLRGDYRSAFSVYLSAAVREHHPEAAFNVAYMYYHGLYVPQSYSLSRRYYMAAQMLDGGAAQFNLALMCLRGQGGAADYHEAARYMKISAANGCVNAQLYLGVAYSRRESNSYGFEWQISAYATEKMFAISYIASPFFFASA